MKDDTYDVVVAGGGAAGLSAALVLGRARRRVAVIDAGAPRNAPAAHMHLLSRDGMPPARLLAKGRQEVAGYGVELLSDQVLGIDPGFVVRLASARTVTARRILIATGAGDELPAIPGIRQRRAKTCRTARTATAGKCGTSRSACWAACRAQSSTPC
jgi:thioredoxin reductase